MAVYYNLKGTTQPNFQLGKGGVTLDTISNTGLGVQGTDLVLNNNVTGTPSSNASLVVERGTSANVAIRWNESTDTWEYTNDGSSYSALGGSGSSVTISDTAPGSPTAGDLWWESDTGILKVYYDDGSSSQWVDASPVPAPNAGITVEAKSTSFNAAVNYRYMITGNSVTATLPSSASLGDTIYFVAGTSTITGFTVGRNGLNIMGLAENMTVDDNTNFAFGLVYNDATNGWRTI